MVQCKINANLWGEKSRSCSMKGSYNLFTGGRTCDAALSASETLLGLPLSSSTGASVVAAAFKLEGQFF